MLNYTTRAESLEASFPKTMPVPPLLLAFANWLAQVPHGSLGYFDALSGEPLETAFPDPAPPPELASRVGIFLHLPDGSRLALWDYGADELAVVLLGSEGELGNVAPTLAAFLTALGNNKTGVNDLDEDGTPERRAALMEWLSARAKESDARKPAATVPSFHEWYEAKVKGSEPSANAPSSTAAPAPAFAMTQFTSRLWALLGRNTDDESLRGFLEALGLWPLPRMTDGEDLYAEDKPRGFCLIFGEEKAGPKPKPRLIGCYYYSEGKDDYCAFAAPMPRAVVWSTNANALATALGPPSSEIRSKKTGALTSQRWKEDDAAKRYVSVGYRNDGAVIETVYAGVLPG